MKERDNELEILLEVGNKNGTLEKIEYLKENRDNERLKEMINTGDVSLRGLKDNAKVF